MSLALLAGCGGPPSGQAQTEIQAAVLRANTAMYDAGETGAAVTGIELAGWVKQPEQAPGMPTSHRSDWTAKLQFKEPLACILMQVDGVPVVRVVADRGEQLPFHGFVVAANVDGKWEVTAATGNYGDFTGPGSWKPIWDKANGLTMGYQVLGKGSDGTPKFRRVNFEPLSKLQPCVVEGSPEHQKLMASIQERLQQAQAAAAEQARKQREAQEAARQQAVAAAAQKQADEAARVKAAADAAQQKADAQRRARLLAVLQPFQGANGAAITTDGGPALGTVVPDAAVDEQKFTVAGHAVNLRELPFQEFTFDGAVDERGTFTFKSSLGGDPVVYGASGDKLASRTGTTIAALKDTERATIDALLAAGRRLGTVAPLQLAVEPLDAAAAKTREPQLALTGLTGSVQFRGRVTPTLAPLFAADLGANKANAWRNKEVVSIRLDRPVKGKGLYVRGANAPSTELLVTINGVHRATVAGIAKLGGVLVAFPAELEVLDVRLEATGAVSVRTVGLVQ